jgi:hypothetical protein
MFYLSFSFHVQKTRTTYTTVAEKLVVTRLVKKVPAFYKTTNLDKMFIRTRHLARLHGGKFLKSYSAGTRFEFRS